ncbi:MAG: HAD hydrolase-like protein [Bacteroides sp.]|nr:HAD hydrolase-like protein [Bacteroides sp.]MCM1420938.1 HAD hydrolase-like protein [Bacteroides sp.]
MSLVSAMFDMDGVLFDSMKNHARCWHETMVHFGMYMSLEEAYMHEGRTGASTINLVSVRERGYESNKEEIEKIYGYKSRLFNACPEAPRMPGAYELLKQVRASGIVPVVVTGSGQKSLIERLNHNFPDIFSSELMVTAFDVKYGKPNPEPYLMGLQKAGNLMINQSFVVENAPLGVKAGVASGCFTIAVNTGPLPDSALLSQGANLLFGSMQELSDSWIQLFEVFNHVKL